MKTKPRNRVIDFYQSKKTSEASSLSILFTDEFSYANTDLNDQTLQSSTKLLDEFLVSTWKQLSENLEKEKRESSLEIRALKEKVILLESKFDEIENLIKEEFALELSLKSEIECLDKIKIDPQNLKSDKWALSFDEIQELLDDE